MKLLLSKPKLLLLLEDIYRCHLWVLRYDHDEPLKPEELPEADDDVGCQLAERIRVTRRVDCQEFELPELVAGGLDPVDAIALAAMCCRPQHLEESQKIIRIVNHCGEADRRFGLWSIDCAERFLVTYIAPEAKGYTLFRDFLSRWRAVRARQADRTAFMSWLFSHGDDADELVPAPFADFIESMVSDEQDFLYRRADLRAEGMSDAHLDPASSDYERDAAMVHWLQVEAEYAFDMYYEELVELAELTDEEQLTVEAWERIFKDQRLAWEFQRLAKWFAGEKPGPIRPEEFDFLPAGGRLSAAHFREFARALWK